MMNIQPKFIVYGFDISEYAIDNCKPEISSFLSVGNANNLEYDNNFFDLVIKSQEEKEIKNLIIYKKAMYNADVATENELLKILNPILKSESVWKSHALLLMADYFDHNNNSIKSKDFLQEIINSELVNNEIRIEAERRLKRNSGG